MVVGGTMREDTGNKEQLETEVWHCLDSVHYMLKRREILHQTLRQGWMEVTSARYSMGPARISSPLFSLKPHAPSAVVDVRGPTSEPTEIADSEEVSASELHEDWDEVPIKSPVVFDLVRDRVEKEKGASAALLGDLNVNDKKHRSQLRRRPVSIPTDEEKMDRWEIRNLVDDSATDSDDDSTLFEVSKDTTQPLHWFGALVSPHLRSAQSNFSKALDLVVELINAQNEAAHAHRNVLGLQRGDSCVENKCEKAQQV